MRLLKSLVFSFVMLSMAIAVSAQNSRDVVPLNPPQPVENDGKIEVLEFFAYGCIHCFNLEPKFEEWIKRQPADVKVRRVPAAFAIRGVDSIQIFYTLEAMALLDKLHYKVFEAINTENIILGNPATLNQWLTKQGVDPKKYEEVQKSFSVQTKIQRARKMSEDYKITATPMLVIMGKHKLEQLDGAERLFGNVDRLINEARATLKATPAPVSATRSKK